jgi:hypothetical protein
LMYVDPEGRQAIIIGPRPIPIPIPVPGITPRPLPILPPVEGTPELEEFCIRELEACINLCQKAKCDSDRRNVWGGSLERCIRGCLPEICGGNKGGVY